MKHVLMLEVFTTDPLQHLSSKVQDALEKAGLTDVRLQCPGKPTISIGALTIDLYKRLVKMGHRPVDLTPKEFELLSILASHPGKTFSRHELLEKVWGFSFEQYEHTVTSHINRLRIKLEPNEKEPVYILTTWGAGYRLAEGA